MVGIRGTVEHFEDTCFCHDPVCFCACGHAHINSESRVMRLMWYAVWTQECYEFCFVWFCLSEISNNDKQMKVHVLTGPRLDTHV